MTALLRELLEQAKKLEPDERAQLIAALERALPAPSIIGLFANEPDAIEEAMAHVQHLRGDWNVRPLP